MIRYFFIALAALAIAGCARPDPEAEAAARAVWQAQQQLLRGIDRWDLQGRAVLRLERAVYQVGIRWRRGPGRFALILEAPFGKGVIRIDSLPSGAYELRLPDGRRFTGSQPDALLKVVTGWSLPVGGLEYWIRGLPRPDSDYRHRSDSDGRARRITQDDWSIRYLDYFDGDDASGPGLPRRIDLARDKVSLRLVIERWQAVATEPAASDPFPDFN